MPNCDGSSGGDSPVMDAPSDKTMGGDVVDSPMSNDVKQEAMGMDGNGGDDADAADGGDAPPDVEPDVPPDGPACDSGVLGDPNNCGGCNMPCDPLSSKIMKRTCNNNSTCAYTCNLGYTDCNSNGCGCSTPNVANAKCCGQMCPIQHQWDEKMVGATYFYDCYAVPQKPSDYSMNLAQDACVAYAGNVNQCSGYTCFTGPPDAGGMMLGNMICSDGNNAPDCRCWGYQNIGSGMMAGFTADMGVQGPNGCVCPDQTSDTWN